MYKIINKIYVKGRQLYGNVNSTQYDIIMVNNK